jgi:hypothetical protein
MSPNDVFVLGVVLHIVLGASALASVWHMRPDWMRPRQMRGIDRGDAERRLRP